MMSKVPPMMWRYCPASKPNGSTMAKRKMWRLRHRPSANADMNISSAAYHKASGRLYMANCVRRQELSVSMRGTENGSISTKIISCLNSTYIADPASNSSSEQAILSKRWWSMIP